MGEVMRIGDSIEGGGGYFYVVDIERLAGSVAAALSARCVDNTCGEIAVVINLDTAIGCETCQIGRDIAPNEAGWARKMPAQARRQNSDGNTQAHWSDIGTTEPSLKRYEPPPLRRSTSAVIAGTTWCRSPITA